MGTKVCTHGMPTPASCLACMEDEGVGPSEDDSWPASKFFPKKKTQDDRVFTAQYDGQCYDCGGDIVEGHRAMYQAGRLIHYRCRD